MTKKTIRNNNEDSPRNEPISVETQVRLWKELAGKWKDDRSTKVIIEDIYNSRTSGRETTILKDSK